MPPWGIAMGVGLLNPQPSVGPWSWKGGPHLHPGLVKDLPGEVSVCVCMGGKSQQFSNIEILSFASLLSSRGIPPFRSAPPLKAGRVLGELGWLGRQRKL